MEGAGSKITGCESFLEGAGLRAFLITCADTLYLKLNLLFISEFICTKSETRL